jgi:tetratricopeptide (TPR) repeat protein
MGAAKSKVIGIVVGLSLLLASAAQAQQDLMALGRQEYETAKKEYNLGHFDKALEHFEASYRLTAAPELLYNLALVNRDLFQRTRKLEFLEDAISRFHTYLDNKKSTQDPKRRATIEGELKSAEDQLAHERASRAKGEEALAVGEDFLKQGRIDDATAQLDQYERHPGNERAGVARAWVLRAGIALAKKDQAAATNAYAHALELDHSITPPTEAKANLAFMKAGEMLGESQPLTVEHTPPASIKAGQPVELVFTPKWDQLHEVASLRIGYRLAGGKAFSMFSAQPGKVALPRPFTLAIPPGARVEYYAEALDAHDAVLEHVGTEAAPFAIQVQEKAKPSIAKKGWFWATMVGVAAVAATGIALGVTLSQPPPPVDVPIHTGLSVK